MIVLVLVLVLVLLFVLVFLFLFGVVIVCIFSDETLANSVILDRASAVPH